MRTDDNLERKSFRFSQAWKKTATSDTVAPEIDDRLRGGEVIDGELVVHSLSGHERNRFFHNQQGQTFNDDSLLSGLDSVADGRGFVLWDYDRDGWQDLAVVNANNPLLNLYHNRIAQTLETASGFIAIRFEGGNITSRSSNQSNRDGYGAVVTAMLDTQLTIKREHRCGEGYASQNSATMILGIGNRAIVPSVTVRWPSGKTTTIENVPSGTLLTAHESIETGPSFVSTLYQVPKPVATSMESQPKRAFPINVPAFKPYRLRVYTTMATWCSACTKKLPELKEMKAILAEQDVEFIGIPIDTDDTLLKLQKYMAQWKPAYQLLGKLTYRDRDALRAFLESSLPKGIVPLPTTVITNESDEVLRVMPGIPSVSELRKLLY